MQQQKNIWFKGIATLLIMAVLLPSTIKVFHVFEHHKHDICTEKTSNHHLHQIDLDCEFYKFKINNTLSFVNLNFTVLQPQDNHKTITSQYQFISTYQRLGIVLRGPPYTV